MKGTHEKCNRIKPPAFFARLWFTWQMRKQGHPWVSWNRYMDNPLGTGCFYCANCDCRWDYYGEPWKLDAVGRLVS